MTAKELIIAKEACDLSNLIAASDVDKGACIYALLCELKTNMNDEFEKALVAFLKHGTGEELFR